MNSTTFRFLKNDGIFVYCRCFFYQFELKKIGAILGEALFSFILIHKSNPDQPAELWHNDDSCQPWRSNLSIIVYFGQIIYQSLIQKALLCPKNGSVETGTALLLLFW